MAEGVNHARLIDGAAMAAAIRRRVHGQCADLAPRHGIRPGLTVIMVGDNPASEIYVRTKLKHAAESGIASRDIRMPAGTAQRELLGAIAALNADPAVDGILVQLPLPDQIDAAAITDAVDPAKDVDGFHPVNPGLRLAGRDALVPCPPLG